MPISYSNSVKLISQQQAGTELWLCIRRLNSSTQERPQKGITHCSLGTMTSKVGRNAASSCQHERNNAVYSSYTSSSPAGSLSGGGSTRRPPEVTMLAICRTQQLFTMLAIRRAQQCATLPRNNQDSIVKETQWLLAQYTYIV